MSFQGNHHPPTVEGATAMVERYVCMCVCVYAYVVCVCTQPVVLFNNLGLKMSSGGL